MLSQRVHSQNECRRDAARWKLLPGGHKEAATESGVRVSGRRASRDDCSFYLRKTCVHHQVKESSEELISHLWNPNVRFLAGEKRTSDVTDEDSNHEIAKNECTIVLFRIRKVAEPG